VEFILEPFYKICAHVVSKEKDQLEPFLATIGVYLKKHEYKIDIKPLLKLVMHRYFGDTSPLVDAIVSHVPDSKTGA
jgi:U5 small nuclear ribonucleoprotein component